MLKTEFHYIRFAKFAPKPNHKTDIWACNNIHTNAQLGIVKWYGPWRQYCLFLGGDLHEIVLSAGCLQDIAEFLGSLMAERKLELKGGG